VTEEAQLGGEEASATAAGEAQQAEDEAARGDAATAEEAPRTRRRRRGGRRHKSAAQRAAEAALRASEGAEAGGQAGAEPTESAEPARVVDAGSGDGAEAPKPAKKRRRPGRARAGNGAEAAEAAGETSAASRPAAEEAVPQGQDTTGTAEGKSRPARRRRSSRRARTAAAGAEAAEVQTEEPSLVPAEFEAAAVNGEAAAVEAATAVVVEAEVAPEVATAPPGEGAEKPTETEARGRRRRPSRRPAGPPPIPPVERIILASQDYGELRVVLLEQGRLAEVYFQRPERPSYLGNIYRARVESVLRGMDAAFVDFGLEKNGFLHVDEVVGEEGTGTRRGRRITQLLQPGQEILVQVTKDPMGSKGARLTTRMSLPGRYLVYVPGGSGVGVSRRLGQEERDRLREVCKKLKVKDAGLIVRTVAEGKGYDELHRDLQYLSRQWSRIKAKVKNAPVPSLVHQEVDVALSTARDLFNDSCSRFIVDTEKLRKEVTAYIKRVAPELVDRVELHEGPEPLFEAWGIEEQLDRTLLRRVTLPSGGNIVIDHAEALTVIDVNSGRYTGGSALEDTITKTNLEAASEVVHQLRLRDIGGIIVIDFIDMERLENRKAVLGKLEAELATDRTKTYVVEISPLGLVEMTRQNTTDGARGILTKPCPLCLSTARIPSEDTVARRVERQLRSTAAASRVAALLIEVNGGVAQRLAGSERIRQLEKRTGKRFLFQGSKTLPIDTFEVIASGTLAEVEAQRIPVVEGAELDASMEHSLTYSPRDAVAVVDGYPVVVKNGRQFLGLRRRIRVETASRSGGTAVIIGSAGAAV
jgi:ribonuclease G